MSETKFTKGEWDLVRSEDPFEDGEMVISMGSNRKCNTSYFSKHRILIPATDGDDQEAMANAHLIATAPDMYELLFKINNIINSELYEIELADAINGISGDIDSLLAKARGEKCN